MTRSKLKHNHKIRRFWQRRRATYFAHGSIGLVLVLLTACSNLPSSIKLPSSIPLPDGTSLPINLPVNLPINQDNPTTSSATPVVEPDQLKLGMLFSLSGSLAKYGNAMQDSTRLLVEMVNGCGGVLNQSVQLLSEDDRSNPDAGKVGMTNLVKTNQVGAVIGAIGSEVSNATVDIAVKNQVVQISPASASPVLTERAKKGQFQGFWFRTMPPDSLQGEALAKLAHEKRFKTVSILAIDNDYGNSIVQAFETTFKQKGGTTSTPSRFSPYASLYDIDFVSAFGETPDAVLLVAEPELGGAILRAAYELGFFSGNTKILLPVSMKTDSLAGQVGQSIDGRYIASNVLGITPKTGSPALTQFQEIYKKRFGRDPGIYDANTWDAAAVAILAAEAAKNSTGAALKSKIPAVANAPGIEVSDVCQALTFVREGKEINYQGVSGTVDFNSTGDSIANYDIWTIDYTGKIQVQSAIQAGETKPTS